jgi:hypothetical protein
MPFPGATGKGIRIAVIDSGVNITHPHIIAKTSGIVLGTESTSFADGLGHGTAVAAAIQEKAPEAEYFAVKLFDQSLAASSGRLLQAIEWAIDNQMDVVNLSLGTPNASVKPALQLLVKEAEAKGIIMVCARHDSRNPVFPGSLDGVVSVDVDWQLDRHAYRVSDGLHYFASGFPRPLPGVPMSRNLRGISFAVANMTGFVARACQEMADRRLQTLQQSLALYTI